MSAPLPESAKAALQQLAGPRYRPAAYPLLELAKAAVHGHAEIAERVKEHQARVDAERADARQLREAVGVPESAPPEHGAQ